MGAAVFGGSFDPVHVGHLHVADSALAIPWVERVYMVPAGRPPHKSLSGGASAAQRLSMVTRSVSMRPEITVLDWELLAAETSYTYPTVTRLMNELPNGERIGLIVGTDLLLRFTSWKNWEDLLSVVTLLLTRHPEGTDPREFAESGDCVTAPDALRKAIREAEVIEHVWLPVSSTLIRDRVRAHARCRDLVPPGAWTVIEQEGLYGYGESHSGW
ncbi:MAG: nicotinate (nicotinamide) nucleotide adenylyltransferase [Spirochaetaceae bacterium]